jgi:drug/metabolite transporter (DMT)-like permease
MAASSVGYGVALPASKASLEHLAPLQVLFWTRAIAGATLAAAFTAVPAVRRRVGSILPLTVGAAMQGVVLGALLFAIVVLLLNGLEGTNASTAGVIMSVHILATPLVAWLVLHERTSRAALVGVLLATAGVAVASGQPGTPGWSTLLLVAAALGMPFHTVALAKGTLSSPPWVLVFGQTCAAMALAAVALRGDLGGAGAMSAAIPLLVGGTVPALFSAMAQAQAQRSLSATTTAVILALEPLAAAALAIALLDEPVTAYLVGGAVLTMAGIAATVRATRRR